MLYRVALYPWFVHDQTMEQGSSPNFAPIAALMGDPARAAMLMALMGGQALTVSELAMVAGLTKSTASAHLSQLAAAGLVAARQSGRHKYMALSGPDVAGLIEALMVVVGGLSTAQCGPLRNVRTGPRDPALRHARLCYDHLAGTLGVRVFDHLLGQGHLTQTAQGLDLTQKGQTFLGSLGVDVPKARASRGPLCRACLDWSARKSHLAGPLGRAVLTAMEQQGWLLRHQGRRDLSVTPKGAQGFSRVFPAVSSATALDLGTECP